jgi:hypothetical protein
VAGEGKSVLMATSMPLIGGMMTGGLGNTDKGHSSAIGGSALDFFKRVCQYYNSSSPSSSACYTFEPHVAEEIFVDLITNNPGPGKITVYLDSTLAAAAALPSGDGLATITLVPTKKAIVAEDRKALGDLALKSSSSSSSSSQKSNASTEGIMSIDSALTVSAFIFIDATYEGDLLALAGLQYAVGRESVITYNESYAGVLFEPSPYGAHQFDMFVDPYKEGQSSPIALVQSGPAGEWFTFFCFIEFSI